MNLFGPSGSQPTTMSHDFSKVPKAEIQRSVFNRDHGLKTTMDAGNLVPVFVDEALPGDTFTLRATGFGRLATPINPIKPSMITVQMRSDAATSLDAWHLAIDFGSLPE